MKREAMAEGATIAAGSNNRVDSSLCSCFFEYETPKVITVKNVPMGILRLVLQTIVIGFIVVFQLWYSRGYQTFLDVEASVTTKVKGFSL